MVSLEVNNIMIINEEETILSLASAYGSIEEIEELLIYYAILLGK